LQLGEGEIDFVPIARALRQMDFQGVASVELSRHAHDAVNAARTALIRWRQAEAAA
jgi:L-ribulose-5-phosphate 3-epimerase